MAFNGPSSFREFLQSRPDFRDPSSSSSPLPALYADLKSHRYSNKTSYDAKIDWWATLLLKACLVGSQWTDSLVSDSNGKQAEKSSYADRLVLHLNQQLIDECTIDEVGRPLGIGTVAMELQLKRRIYPLKEYLASSTALAGPSTSQSRIRSIAYSAATTPISWAFSQLSLSLGLGEDGNEEESERDWTLARGDWVLWDNLNTMTDAILSAHRDAPRLSPLESLYSLQTFQSQLVEPALRQCSKGENSTPLRLSSLDMQVLIKFMTRDRGVAASDGHIIKLAHIEGEPIKVITEEERGVVTVKDTYNRLELQIEEIEKRIKERQSKVEACLREKKKEQALSYLRSRKMLEDLLEKRTKSMETLHGVLLKIEQAASDVEIVKAYELSTTSLKALLSDQRLQPDRIDASMEKMQDTLADADEVRRAVEAGNEGMRRAAGEEEIDNEEMEAELKKLEEENKREEQEKKEAEKISREEAKEKQKVDAIKGNEKLPQEPKSVDEVKEEKRPEAEAIAS